MSSIAEQSLSDVRRRDGNRAIVGHGIGRVAAEVEQREIRFFRVCVEVPQIGGDLGADRDVWTQRPVERARQRGEAAACAESAHEIRASPRSLKELPAQQGLARLPAASSQL